MAELSPANEEIHRIQENEKAKFIAAALDRFSTTLLGVGAISPVIAFLFSHRPLPPWELIKLTGIFVVCGLGSYLIHLWGRSHLKRLR
ncbi:hypothetical protein C7477_13112 [Phyllobacterium leguminum]|uniref:YrhK-like protein n=1 Tax=Phyllobacterium leguminum TaxID=314237 RepID=A0A318STW8_9HYPH|nr:hypothetical protein C7477_13112 [Phyllobacterium leguminum]